MAATPLTALAKTSSLAPLAMLPRHGCFPTRRGYRPLDRYRFLGGRLRDKGGRLRDKFRVAGQVGRSSSERVGSLLIYKNLML
jgi:hypothetical protein